MTATQLNVMNTENGSALMTKEEYFAKLERAEKQIEQGEYSTFESAEALDEYIRSL